MLQRLVMWVLGGFAAWLEETRPTRDRERDVVAGVKPRGVIGLADMHRDLGG